MIPKHFALEVADRCDILIDQCWQTVASPPVLHDPRGPMTTTLLLALAMPMIIIPYERLLKRTSSEDKIRLGLSPNDVRARLDVPTHEIAAFAGSGWYHYISTQPLTGLTDVEAVVRDGLDGQFGNTARARALDTHFLHLITGLRHALAHGTVAYLDANCRVTDQQVEIVAFPAEKRRQDGSFVKTNIYAIREANFRTFLGNWAQWLREVAPLADLHRFYVDQPREYRPDTDE